MNKKLIATLAAVQIAALALGAAGCGPASEGGGRGKVQLTFYAVINENNSEIMTEVVNNSTKRTNAIRSA